MNMRVKNEKQEKSSATYKLRQRNTLPFLDESF